ncbi:MAG: bifunctional nuclease family protein [Chloroflexi bacterium]|nr:bifunctional nuclease family protein [Chloroflexota bacterium]
MIEVEVDSIRVSLVTYQRVVILKVRGTERYLPIWIGPSEADAIAVELQKVAVARPLTHDLLRNVIAELGAQVTHIIVNDLHDDVFYARIMLDVDGRHVEMDSRPSDAIALAVRTKVPIYVEEVVLEKAAVGLTTEGEPAAVEEGGELKKPDISQLSAFHDFINTLDLDKLDKPGQEKP